MSALLAPQPSKRSPASATPTSAPKRLGVTTFGVLLVVVLAAGIGLLLVLNTKIQEQSAQLSDLRYEAISLQEKESAFSTQLEGLTSSYNLANAASEQGLVPPAGIGYLNLGDGKVHGDPKPAKGNEYKTIKTRAQQIAEAEAKAKADALALTKPQPELPKPAADISAGGGR